MTNLETNERLDRHALVMAFWLPTSVVAGSLLHYGLQTARPVFILGGFGVVIAGFVGHVVVNAVLKSDFTIAEIALGLVLILTSLVAFGLAVLFAGDSVAVSFVPLSIGGVALVATIGFYMLSKLGTRGAFESFYVIRSFGPKDQERP